MSEWMPISELPDYEYTFLAGLCPGNKTVWSYAMGGRFDEFKKLVWKGWQYSFPPSHFMIPLPPKETD